MGSQEKTVRRRLVCVPSLTFNPYDLLSRASDPLIHHGRHFGRTVHAMCNVQALITNGILRMGDDVPDESRTSAYVLF
jgi:hypothetical protein